MSLLQWRRQLEREADLAAMAPRVVHLGWLFFFSAHVDLRTVVVCCCDLFYYYRRNRFYNVPALHALLYTTRVSTLFCAAYYISPHRYSRPCLIYPIALPAHRAPPPVSQKNPRKWSCQLAQRSFHNFKTLLGPMSPLGLLSKPIKQFVSLHVGQSDSCR